MRSYYFRMVASGYFLSCGLGCSSLLALTLADPPLVRGAHVKGGVIYAVAGGWLLNSGEEIVSRTYHWERKELSIENAGAVIDGAVNTHYRISDSDVGNFIRVVETVSVGTVTESAATHWMPVTAWRPTQSVNDPDWSGARHLVSTKRFHPLGAYHTVPWPLDTYYKVVSAGNDKVFIGGEIEYPFRGVFKQDLKGNFDFSFDTSECFRDVPPGKELTVLEILPLSDGRVVLYYNLSDHYDSPHAGEKYLDILDAEGSRVTFSGQPIGIDTFVASIEEAVDGKIMLYGLSHAIRFNMDGSADESFQMILSPSTASIRGGAVAPDGGVIVGTDYYEREPEYQFYVKIMKLTSTGMDTGFTHPVVKGSLAGITMCDDGSVLIFGNFKDEGDLPLPSALKLSPEGNIDEEFLVSVSPAGLPLFYQTSFECEPLAGGDYLLKNYRDVFRMTQDGVVTSVLTAPGDLHDLEILPSGKIAAVGSFWKAWYDFSILEEDGTLASPYDFLLFPCRRLYPQSDGKLFAAGPVVDLRTGAPGSLCRLMPDGSLDRSFSPPYFETNGEPAVIRAEILEDGKVFVAGKLDSMNGESLNTWLVKLNQDGSPDTSFDLSEVGEWLHLKRVESDGSIEFFRSGSLYRLNPDGSLQSQVTLPPLDSLEDGYVFPLNDGGSLVRITKVVDYHNYPLVRSSRLKKYNDEGILDSEFESNSPAEFPHIKNVLALDTGKILLAMVVSDPDAANPLHRSGIIRLNADGSVDDSFQFESPFSGGYEVWSMVSDSDGTFYAHCKSTEPTGYVFLVHVFENGDLDHSWGMAPWNLDYNYTFRFQFEHEDVFTFAPAGDGSLYVSGTMEAIDGVPMMHRFVRKLRGGYPAGPVATTAPEVSGEMVPDSLLNVSPVSWSPGSEAGETHISVRWELADDVSGSATVAIDGDATGCVLTSQMVGKYVRAVVIASDTGFGPIGLSSTKVTSPWYPVPASTYSIWREFHFGEDSEALADALPESNPDGDLLDNEHEWLFALDPNSPDETPGEIRWKDGFLELGFRRPLGADDTLYKVEITSDMETWFTVDDASGAGPVKWLVEDLGDTTERVWYRSPTAGAGGRQFMRAQGHSQAVAE